MNSGVLSTVCLWTASLPEGDNSIHSKDTLAKEIVDSYPSFLINPPHADSISATQISGNSCFQPPAFARRTNGLSWRVCLVEDHKCPCFFSNSRIRSAELCWMASPIWFSSAG